MSLSKKITDSFESRFRVENIEKNLKLHRWFMVIGIVCYVLWSPFTSYVLDLWKEPFYWRVLGSAGWIITLLLSYKSAAVRNRIDELTGYASMLTSLHFIWFVVGYNGWAETSISAFTISIFLMTFCSGIFINSHLQLVIYNSLVSSSIYLSYKMYATNYNLDTLLPIAFSSITFFILLHFILVCKKLLLKRVQDGYDNIKMLLSKGFGPIIMVKDGVVEYENPAFEEVFGIKASGIKEEDLIADGEPYKTIGDKQVRIDRHRIKLQDDYFCVLNVQDVSEQLKNNLKKMELSKLASIGELSAGIAHEINNPLLQIQMLVYQAQNDDSKREESLTEIANTVDRIAGIVKSLREYSDGGTKDKQEVSLNSVIDKVLVMTRQKVRTHDVDLKLNIEQEDILSTIQESKIGSVLINIINNSCYAVKDKENKLVELSLKRINNRTAEIIIKDSGDGISPEIAKKIFDPFFTTKKVGQGTGLGLSESIAIIKEHGGSLTLEQNKPPVFKIILPIKENS